MRLGSVVALTLMLCGAPAAAQTPAADPYVKGARGQFALVQTLVMRSAEKIGEDLYTFKPTPEVRSVGEVLDHIAGANTALCSLVAGKEKVADATKGPAAKQAPAKKVSKADVIAALKESRSYCESVFDSLTDARAQETLPFVGPDSLSMDSITLVPTPKLIVLTAATSHAWEHYGNLVTYMRLKGIVPPSSERRAQ